MPNFTTPIPPKLTGETERDIAMLKNWGTALIDELTYLFNNLDSSNVIEAASVKAENIETTNAKIKAAQIGTLSADNLKAGKINTEFVTVGDDKGYLDLSGARIVVCDKHNERFVAEYDPDLDWFRFVLCNEDGVPTVSINSDGDAIFSGTVESAKIYSSTIIGTDSDSFENYDGDVFANIDQTGIKVMKDTNGNRQQKIGMSVADDGTAYLVLGAGNGSGKHSINGIVYTNGAFVEEKNDSYARLGLVGYKPNIYFWEDSEELWLNGSRVIVDGRDIGASIDELNNRILTLENALAQ